MNNILLCLLVCIIGFKTSLAQEFVSLKSVEKELSNVYDTVLSEYGEDRAFIDKLIVSQATWLAYRDAEFEMKFPIQGKGYYGSVFEECKNLFLLEITRDRINKLKEWIEGVEEGDVCKGSIKIKDE